MALLKQLLPKTRKKAKKKTENELVEYLIRNPEVTGNLDLSGLCPRDWCRLLSHRPEFIGRCDTGKIPRNNITELVVAHPWLLPYFPPAGINWRDILCSRPELIDKLPENRRLTRRSWVIILNCQPGLWDHSPKKFSSGEWAGLICRHPGFWVHSPQKFSSEEWARIICLQPQLADKCPWEEMIYPPNEIEEIEIQPAKSKPRKRTVHKRNLSWKKCLLKHPDIILAHRPDWKQYYNLDHLNSYELADILDSNPEIVNMTDFPAVVNSDMWRSILYKFPQLVKYCDVKKYFPGTPLYLIVKQPELAKFLDMDNIDAEGIHSPSLADFIKSQPQLADKVLNFLDGDGWEEVLYEHPEYLLKRDGWRYSFPEGVKAFTAAEFWDLERTGLDSICNLVYSWPRNTIPAPGGLFRNAGKDPIPLVEFLLKSVMDPENAELYLSWQLHPGKWDYLVELLDEVPGALSKIITRGDILFLLIAAAPQPLLEKFPDLIPDPAAWLDRNGNTLLHAALLRAALDDVRSLLDSDNPYRARYDHLLKRGCDPDRKNNYGFSCNDLIDMVRQFPHTKG